MTGGASPRLPRRGGTRFSWAALIVGASLIGSAVPASAQYEQELSLRQSEYSAALQAYRSRQNLAETQQNLWLAAAQDSITLALASGDSRRIQRADQLAKRESLELHRQRMLVEELEAGLIEKTRALQETLEQQANAWEARLANASPAERQALNARIDGNWALIRRIEPQEVRSPMLFYPNIVLLPQDGRVQIQNKIEFLQHRIQQAQADLVRVNSEIDRLSKQANNQRLRGDAAANLSRFGEDPPGARAGRPPEPQTGPGAEPAAPLSAQQQIEALEAWKSALLMLQQQLNARVAQFRGALTSIGGELR